MSREFVEQKDTGQEELLSFWCAGCQTAVWATNKPVAVGAVGFS